MSEAKIEKDKNLVHRLTNTFLVERSEVWYRFEIFVDPRKPLTPTKMLSWRLDNGVWVGISPIDDPFIDEFLATYEAVSQ